MVGRQIFTALVAVALLFTAQGAAFARGQAPATDQIVICTYHGAVRIHVDADGAPTAAPQLCWDAVTSIFAAVDLPQESVPRAEQAAPLAWPMQSDLSIRHFAGSPVARGPPSAA